MNDVPEVYPEVVCKPPDGEVGVWYEVVLNPTPTKNDSREGHTNVKRSVIHLVQQAKRKHF